MASAPDSGLIYLDYNATTPTDPRVAEAMLPFLTGGFGNPSSAHALGRAARAAVETARRRVADLLGAAPEGVIFTSGGTEANNHAILGAVRRDGRPARHLVTSAVEHPAVSAPCAHLERQGHRVTTVAVDAAGRVDPDAVEAAWTAATVLVTIMHANNEVGTLQPVAEIARRARRRGILTHSDCAQSLGKVPVTLDLLGVDMITLAGHKLYAPKGIGALVLRSGVELPPLLFGAGHESGRRPGTENVLEIVGLGRACELIAAEGAQETERLTGLRDRLQAALLAACPDARVHGHPVERLPNTLSIGFPGHEAGRILAGLETVAVSAGAACHDGGAVVSPVLRAMGVAPELAAGTLRISLGRMTTAQEIDRALPLLLAAVAAA